MRVTIGRYNNTYFYVCTTFINWFANILGIHSNTYAIDGGANLGDENK